MSDYTPPQDQDNTTPQEPQSSEAAPGNQWFAFASNELVVLMGAVAGLVLITVLAIIFLPEASEQPLSVNNDSPGGVSRVRAWLESEGYNVSRAIGDPINPTNFDVLYILSPAGQHSPEEVERITGWVREGGTLIIASDIETVNPLLEAFDLSIDANYVVQDRVALSAPTLTRPAVVDVPLRFPAPITAERDDTVPHFIAEDTPVLVSFREEEGNVFVMGSAFPFTNSGFRADGSRRLIANFMGGTIPGETRVGFDEGQIGDGSQLPPSILAWLLSSNAGRGTVLFGVMMLAYFISQGRRFGRPVPLEEDRLRREPVEYIVALASLFRRSGRRPETLQHYKKHLRRRLAERYALDPSMSDSRFAHAAAARNKSINEDELRSLFTKLDKENASEAEMLATAAEVNEWLNRFGAR